MIYALVHVRNLIVHQYDAYLKSKFPAVKCTMRKVKIHANRRRKFKCRVSESRKFLRSSNSALRGVRNW